MKKIIFLSLGLLLFSLIPEIAKAQSQRNPCFYATSSSTGCTSVSGTNPLPVSASVSVSGFAPATTGTPISVTTGGVTGTLPAGAVVAAFNVGTTNTAYCKLGASATTSDIAIPPASWFAFTVGVATQLTCITSTSTTTVNMVGGSGIPTGAGGGGGGSGGTVAQGNAGSNAQAWWAQIGDTARGPAKVQAGNAAAVADVALTVTDPNVLAAVNSGVGTPASVVPATGIYVGGNVAGNFRGWTGVNPSGSVYSQQMDLASVNGVTASTGTGAVGTGTARIAVGTDTATVAGTAPATAGIAATGAAPPAGSIQVAAVASGATGGLMAGLKTCDLHATYDASANGSVEMVAAVSGRTIYICGFILATGGTATNLKLVDGTGTNCATGTPVDLTPAYQLVANDKIGANSAFWNGLKTTGTNRALCVNASAGNAHQAEVWYTIQ